MSGARSKGCEAVAVDVFWQLKTFVFFLSSFEGESIHAFENNLSAMRKTSEEFKHAVHQFQQISDKATLRGQPVN